VTAAADATGSLSGSALTRSGVGAEQAIGVPRNVGSGHCVPAAAGPGELCSGQGVPLEIFTNASLPGSGELYNWIQAGQVIIRPIP